MNWAHVHLVFNHVPILGVPIGLLLLGAGMLRKSAELQRAGLVGLAAVALIALPVYFTGEPAEEMVENLAGVSEERIKQHEEWALPTVIVVEATGLLALAGLFLFREKTIPRPFLMGILLASLVATGFLARTAMLGGEIRHTEVRSGTLLNGGEEGEKHEEGE